MNAVFAMRCRRQVDPASPDGYAGTSGATCKVTSPNRPFGRSKQKRIQIFELSRSPRTKKKSDCPDLCLWRGGWQKLETVAKFFLLGYTLARTSVFARVKAIFFCFFLRKQGKMGYLPMQKREKIFSRMSGSAYSPVMRPRASRELRRGMAARSQR